MALTRRDLLKSGVAVAATSSVSPFLLPRVAGAQGKRGGMLRVRGYDPPHFDPHQTLNFKTNNTLSFVHVKLVRHKVGAAVTPGVFAVEPDLAERWEEPDDMTVVFYLRRGVRWHNKPPVNGRELTAEDVKFTYDRFLTEKGNPQRFMLDPVDRVGVVDGRWNPCPERRRSDRPPSGGRLRRRLFEGVWADAARIFGEPLGPSQSVAIA